MTGKQEYDKFIGRKNYNNRLSITIRSWHNADCCAFIIEVEKTCIFVENQYTFAKQIARVNNFKVLY